MQTRTRPFALLALGVAVALTACADMPTSNSAGTIPIDETETLALSLDELAADAALLGNTEEASDFQDGALALRLGAVPSEISVSVAGEELRYRAIVTGVVMRGRDGEADVMRRSIVAWRGFDRPEKVLRLAARADEAVFGGREISTDPALAVGTFADFERHVRLRAIDGTLGSRLATLGGPCPNAAGNPSFACNLARFDMRLDGLFEVQNRNEALVRISSEETAVSGVVVRRTDGGSGGRPTANPTTARG